MVQVEGVARALDPKHDIWGAAQPIVERWVKRELGPEGVTKRVMEELAIGLTAFRRLPQTLEAMEGAAHALRRNAEAKREHDERAWATFWAGIVLGGMLVILFALASHAH
jgi:ubiquinone biosynthesis protein